MSNTTFGNGTETYGNGTETFYNGTYGNGTYGNGTYYNTTYGNETFYNTTLFSDEEDPDMGQLVLPIIMGLVIVCACCIGACVCYKNNKETKEWAAWVRAKKRGDPMTLV